VSKESRHLKVKIVNKCCLQGTRQSTALWTSNRETLSRRPALPFSCTWYHFCSKNSFIVDVGDQAYVSMSYYFSLGKCCSALFYFYQKGVDVEVKVFWMACGHVRNSGVTGSTATGAIAGGVVGAVLLIVVLPVLCLVWYRRRQYHTGKEIFYDVSGMLYCPDASFTCPWYEPNLSCNPQS
jgi:hypothetical protein